MHPFSDPARIASFRYSNPCVNVEQIYNERRGVYDDLSFYVPLSQPRHSKTIRIADVYYEVWSPNSEIIDFYPGAPDSSILPASHVPAQPFPDGRMGPQDWSLHPQHFSSSAPWLGFCRVPPTFARDWFSIEAELVPLPLVWQYSNSRPGYGRLDEAYVKKLNARAWHLGSSVANYRYDGWGTGDQLDYVLRHFPKYPSPDVIKRLCIGKYWIWQELVDLFTAAQRGLREMEAWLTMMEYWGQRLHSSVPTIPQVANDRLGVWLNGASEAEGLWLLRIGVIPVYIIHRYEAGVDFPEPSKALDIHDRRPTTHLSNFVQSTPAEPLNSDHWNIYLLAFSRGSGKTLPYIPAPLPFRTLYSSSCPRSSSWAFRTREREQQSTGVRDGHTSSHAPQALSKNDQTWDLGRRLPAPTYGNSDPPQNPSPPKTAPLTNQKKGELVDEGSISFWKPPPVAYGPESRPAANKKLGKKRKKKTTWFRFYEVDDEPGLPVPDGQTAMLLKSKRKGEESDDSDSEPEYGGSLQVYATKRTVWDRRRGRRLTFIHPLSRDKRVHYDVSTFGLPLPDISYWMDDGNRFDEVAKSTWAYLDPHPKSRDQVGSEPSLEDCRPNLPPVPELSAPVLTAGPSVPQSPLIQAGSERSLEEHQPDLHTSAPILVAGPAVPSTPQSPLIQATSGPSLEECQPDPLPVPEVISHSLSPHKTPVERSSPETRHEVLSHENVVLLDSDLPQAGMLDGERDDRLIIPRRIDPLDGDEELDWGSDDGYPQDKSDNPPVSLDHKYELEPAMTEASVNDVSMDVELNDDSSHMIANTFPRLGGMGGGSKQLENWEMLVEKKKDGIDHSERQFSQDIPPCGGLPERPSAPPLPSLGLGFVGIPDLASRISPNPVHVSQDNSLDVPNVNLALSPGQSSTRYPFRRRGKNRGVKKNRGGIRQALHKRFGKPFWEIAQNITLEDFASLPIAQQQYILHKRAELEGQGQDVESDDEMHG